MTSIDVGRAAAEDRSATDLAARPADGGHDGRTASLRDVLGAYVGLTKPRIIELLLVTTVPAMFLAAGGVPPLLLVLNTMLGGCLAAASANVVNCVLDRDIDEQMRRTRRRPLPRHAVGPGAAAVFGAVLGVAATLYLGFFVNWLSAGLALAANAFYVVVYTLLLKRRTSQNIVWGGIAGCFPPLIGWTAVTGSVALAPFVLFAIVFFWTPPHTWALAFRYREDYAAAKVPMLPVVAPAPAVAARILAYSVVTVAVSLALWPVAGTGWLYPTVAAVTGVALLWESLQLLLRARRGLTDAALRPMRLFHWSNSYLALVFVAAAVDPLLR
ncbi:protoheme IX farnesyltransferase [Friedmanniella luteola]|uniref:Protoheme IX farnesyltransferase n=1 Tax=Friedmanniella luteola TaxID=546871 RepID=A0A1H1PJY1_9ACTN|nr:heme o synthase [Friedmanniella luteola]SDS11454.1 protoheme IX farnesyltransferase [Friedmanniella luteola]